MTLFVSGADDDGETCTRVCLTGGRELLHNGAREEDSKATVDGQEGKRKKLCSMDMVVFDCEDEEESRPAATGDGAFNFGCLGWC